MATAPPLSLPFNWRWPWNRAEAAASSELTTIAGATIADPTPADLLRMAVSQR